MLQILLIVSSLSVVIQIKYIIQENRYKINNLYLNSNNLQYRILHKINLYKRILLICKKHNLILFLNNGMVNNLHSIIVLYYKINILMQFNKYLTKILYQYKLLQLLHRDNQYKQ